jgi:hypothetical protein
MPKLSTLSVGHYIRHHRDGRLRADGSAPPILKIEADEGSTYRCHPLLKRESGVDTIDQERFYFIDKEQEVERVFP